MFRRTVQGRQTTPSFRRANLRLERLEDRLAPHTGVSIITDGITPNAGLTGIVFGPDDNYWVAETNASRIARIREVGTPGGTVEFTLPAGRGPLNIIVGPDNFIYFTESSGDRIGRLNPLAGSDAAIQASIQEFAVPGAGSRPHDLVTGPDGAIWFTQAGSNEIGRMTTAGVVTNEFAVPNTGTGQASNPSIPSGIALGGDGNLWFTQAGSGQIGRITTAGTITEFNIPIPNAAAFSDPEDITAGPNGLYFTDFGRDQVSRITFDGQITQFNLITGRGPHQIAFNGDGNLYFTMPASGRIGKLPANALAPGRPTSGEPPLEEFDFINRDSVPLGLALGGGETGIEDIYFTLNGQNAVATFAAHLAQVTITSVGPTITVVDINLNPVPDGVYTPFPGYNGNLNLAVQDMAGAHAVGSVTNGVPDTIVGTASGPPAVKIIDNSTQTDLASFFAFDPGFLGGVSVAADDVNGDGRNDLIVASGTHIKVIDGTKLGDVGPNGVINNSALLASFFAFPFGAVSSLSLAAGDIDRDGKAEIIVGAGPGAPGGHVLVINGARLTQVQSNGQIAPSALMASFFAFGPGFLGGVTVAVAFNVSERNIIVGAGPGAGPHVKIIDKDMLGQVNADGQISDSALLASFFAFDPAFRGGVRVAADDLSNADGVPEIIIGAGPGAGPAFLVINGAMLNQVLPNGQIAPSAVLASYLVGPANFTGGVSVAADADHRDATFGGTSTTGVTAAQSRRDVNDMYIFQSPTNAANTVMAMTVSPFTGPGTTPLFEPGVIYDLRVVNSNLTAATDDLVFRVTFGPADPGNNNAQDVEVRALPAAKFPATGGVIVKAFTNSNVAVRGVGGSGAMFRAADQDDPFYFDTNGFGQFLNAAANATPPGIGTVLSNGTTAADQAVGPYPTGTSNGGAGDPNPPGDGLGFNSNNGNVFPAVPEDTPDYNGVNFFANSNTLAITLELPSALLAGLPAGTALTPDTNAIGFWGRTEANGVQQDRMGRPAINTALIPPIPRNSTLTPAQMAADLRTAFNMGHPRDDRTNFAAAMSSVLAGVYPVGGNGQAPIVASLLLPDILVLDPTSNAGFFQDVVGTIGAAGGFLAGGRKFTDDTISIELGVLSDPDSPFNLDAATDPTNQPALIATQNVADDNGLAITDGSRVGPRPAGDPLLNAQRAAMFPYFAPPNPNPSNVPNPPGGPR